MISPSFQRTAWETGPPVSGSISPVVEPPAIHPRALITLAELSLPPGSVPRSVRSKRTLVTVLLSVHEQVMWTLSKTVTSVRLPFNNPTTEELLKRAEDVIHQDLEYLKDFNAAVGQLQKRQEEFQAGHPPFGD